MVTYGMSDFFLLVTIVMVATALLFFAPFLRSRIRTGKVPFGDCSVVTSGGGWDSGLWHVVLSQFRGCCSPRSLCPMFCLALPRVPLLPFGEVIFLPCEVVWSVLGAEVSCATLV